MSSTERVFPSGANQVELVRRGSGLAVRKTYQAQLKSYPERWPVSRREVEAFLLGWMRDHCAPGVRVPALLERGENFLLLEHCPGTPLAECATARLRDAALWRALFETLYALRLLRWDALDAETQALLSAQRPILDCMLRWKTQGDISPDRRPNRLCLGDVSLHNILFSGELVLLDFECGHWGYAGYDMGQLLAMAETHWPASLLEETIYPAFFHAAADERERQDCLYWRDRLKPYYTKTRERE